MGNLKEGTLEIIVNEGDKIIIEWLGRSENREPSALLNPYFKDIVENASGKEVEVDFTKLEYMNSSTVPPIIHMIKNLDTKGISTKIYYNKDSKWQAASFKALETISNSLNSIEVLGK